MAGIPREYLPLLILLILIQVMNYKIIKNRKKVVIEKLKGLHMKWNEFDKIKPNTQKPQEYISINKGGMITISSSLMKNLENNQLEVYLSKDAKSIGIEESEDNCIKIPKSGRFRNYDLEEKLFSNKIKLPVCYIGKWNVDLKSKEKYWIGEMTHTNPRTPKKRRFKS